QRLKMAVKEVTAIGLDIDNATPDAEIIAAVKKQNCAAVIYSTHSYMNTKSSFKKDEIIRYLGPDREINDEGMQEYLARKKNWHESIIPSIKVMEEVHETGGIMVVIKHAPIPKNRIIIPLRDPYVIAKEGKTQIEAANKWAKYVSAMGTKLQLAFDPAC